MTKANNKQGTSDPLFYTKLHSQRCFWGSRHFQKYDSCG